jgi:hypothetical protein
VHINRGPRVGDRRLMRIALISVHLQSTCDNGIWALTVIILIICAQSSNLPGTKPQIPGSGGLPKHVTSLFVIGQAGVPRLPLEYSVLAQLSGACNFELVIVGHVQARREARSGWCLRAETCSGSEMLSGCSYSRNPKGGEPHACQIPARKRDERGAGRESYALQCPVGSDSAPSSDRHNPPIFLCTTTYTVDGLKPALARFVMLRRC